MLSASGTNKARKYTRADEVDAAFGDAVKAAARVYFQQDPYPEALVVGRWARDSVDSLIRGGGLRPDAVALLGDVWSGSFEIDGAIFTGIDLSSASTGAAIATAVQTALTDPATAWDDGLQYGVGERVSRLNVNYKCVRAHESETGSGANGEPGNGHDGNAWVLYDYAGVSVDFTDNGTFDVQFSSYVGRGVRGCGW